MKTVHLIGIAGTGMVSLAGLFKAKGWKVRGSDQNIYPPASVELEKIVKQNVPKFMIDKMVDGVTKQWYELLDRIMSDEVGKPKA